MSKIENIKEVTMDKFKVGETYVFQGELTGNKRDMQTLSPKVLMLNVSNWKGEVFRDHCWIPANSKRYRNLIPAGHSNKKVLIQFSARVEEYMSSEGTKLGLKHIRDVIVL